MVFSHQNYYLTYYGNFGYKLTDNKNKYSLFVKNSFNKHNSRTCIPYMQKL